MASHYNLDYGIIQPLTEKTLLQLIAASTETYS